VATAVFIAAATFVAWRARHTWPFILVGWFWFLGTLVPVIGIVQVGMQGMADRYTYIPSVGIFFAVVWGVVALASRARVAPLAVAGAGAIVVLALAVAAHAQASTWATNESLWRHAVQATTNNPRARIELGAVYGKQSRHAEAEAELTQALQMKLADIDAKDLFRNLSGALVAQGKFAEAIPKLEQAVELDQARVELRHHLAIAYARVGRPNDAIACWREAIRRDPKFEEPYVGLSVLLAGQGRIEEARKALIDLLAINPNRKDAQQALARLTGK
jgi:tetratricopeptide (TPR) repeat protein